MKKNDYVYVYEIEGHPIEAYYTVRTISKEYIRLRGDFDTITISIYDRINYRVVDRDLEEFREQQWTR